MRNHKLITLLIGILLSAELSFAATKIFLHDAVSKLGRLTRDKAASGCGNGTTDWIYRSANTTQGTTTVTDTFSPTSTAPPCIAQSANGADLLVFVTPPISSGVTISGNINYSAGCRESATALNAGFHFVVYKWSAADNSIASIVHTSANTTECGTTAALRTIAAAAPTSTAFSVGDRIVITVEVRNVGGAWGGNSTRTSSLLYDGAAASTGDAFANFVDNISFSADTSPSWPTSQ